MVTHDEEHLREALRLITSVQCSGNLECPWCGLHGLSTLELWTHQPLYHIYELDLQDVHCPACHKRTSRLTRHISLSHGPTPGVDERTGVFALAIIRRPTDGKFLLVQERYAEGYWVPGGGVDPGESLRDGVVREAREEAGADIKVTGILTVESFHRKAWRRIIFLAEPLPEPSTTGNTGEVPGGGRDVGAGDGTSGGRSADLQPHSSSLATAAPAVAGPLTTEHTIAATPTHPITTATTITPAAASVPASSRNSLDPSPPAGPAALAPSTSAAEALPPGPPVHASRGPHPHPHSQPHLHSHAHARPRYRCKTLPDVESAGACWVAADQLPLLPLRSASEPMTWIPWVAQGGAVMALDPAACPDLLSVFPDYPL